MSGDYDTTTGTDPGPYKLAKPLANIGQKIPEKSIPGTRTITCHDKCKPLECKMLTIGK